MKKIASIIIASCLSSSVAIAELDSYPQVNSLRADQFGHQPTQNQAPNNHILQYMERVEALQQDVQQLRGQLEEQSYHIHQLKLSAQQETAMLKRQISNLSKADSGIPSSAQKTASDPTGVNLDEIYKRIDQEKEQVQEQAPITDAKAYKNAYRLLQKKKYDEAEQAFNQFISKFPHSQYTANSHYWVGEIHLLDADFKGAKSAFASVLDKFPTHTKSADAMLKLGFVAYQEKDFDQARKILSDVKTKYPKSSSARLADGRLKRMKSEGV